MKSRRDILSSIALAAPAVALGALPAIASTGQADPVFAAIERHRAAYQAFEAAVTAEGRLETALPRSRTRSESTADGETIVEGDDPRWIAAIRKRAALCDAEEVAAMALLNVSPTTLAGLAAILSYAAEHAAGGGMWPDSVEDTDRATPLTFGWEHFLFERLGKVAASFAATV